MATQIVAKRYMHTGFAETGRETSRFDGPNPETRRQTRVRDDAVEQRAAVRVQAAWHRQPVQWVDPHLPRRGRVDDRSQTRPVRQRRPAGGGIPRIRGRAVGLRSRRQRTAFHGRAAEDERASGFVEGFEARRSESKSCRGGVFGAEACGCARAEQTVSDRHGACLSGHRLHDASFP